MPIPPHWEYAESSLTVALDGQLHWVKRPILAFSGTTRPYVISDADYPPSVWWPSILFHDYDDFQFFFSEELRYGDDNDDCVAETRELILSRMFNNMRHKRTIMVAGLLGRSLKEFVEIVEIPLQADKNTQEVHVHEATQYVSFTRLPQEVYLPQIKPIAFTVTSNNNTTIDDDLYMSYMHALDLAATKRIGGPKAPHDTLRSDFREIGRKEIQKLTLTMSSTTETCEEASVAIQSTTEHESSIDDHVGFSCTNADELVNRSLVELPLKRISTETPLIKINANATTASSASRNTYMERDSNREYAPDRRGSVVSDKSMCPGGSLTVTRLHPGFDHIPIEARRNARNNPKLKCAMHRWLGDRKEGKLGYCRTCNVNLCTDCYDIFHTIDDLDKIRTEFSRRKEIQATRRLKRQQKRKENNMSKDDKKYPYPKKESTCSDKSLGTEASRMSLANRTNFSQCRHIPIPPRRHASCAMHRWLGFRREGNLCFCPDCNITLCRTCYDDFHKTKNIVAKKFSLQREYKERGEQKQT